jgi:hypothetical protein
MSTKEYNAALNKAYLEGYKCGFDAGKQEAVMSKVTPNELRKTLGLPPITKEAREVNMRPQKIDWKIWFENMRCL